MRIRIIFLLFLFFLTLFPPSYFSLAKELKVKSFELLPTDLSARTKKVHDLNLDLCALIKISIPERECRFDGQVVQQEYDISEYLVFVSPGTRKFQIKYQGAETLNLDLTELLDGESIQSGATYRLHLTGYEDNLSLNPSEVSLAHLDIKSQDIDALIKVNNQNKGTGNYSGSLTPGIYQIEVFKANHKPYSTTVELSKNESISVSIPKLPPLFGTLNVTIKPEGSIITIDGVNVGTSPAVLKDVPLGNHTISISKDGYITKNFNSVLLESETFEINGSLEEKPSSKINEMQGKNVMKERLQAAKKKAGALKKTNN